MDKNQLSIRLQGEPVGILKQTSTGKKTFTYNSNPFMPISVSMPIREQPYGEMQCEAFFGGLLPESEAAKKIGLSAPEVELRKIKDITFLLIERYDRRIKNDYIERVHQEDFCQALSVLSSRKYQNEGGPGFKECFRLLNDTTQPAINRTRLVSAVVFNYLVGNMDAHGKNFSLLYNTPSTIHLAPFYDIVCTRVYQTLTSKMAMKIGNKYDADRVLPRHWKQFSEEINYRYRALADLVVTLGNRIKKAALQEKEQIHARGISHPIIDKIINFIDDNIVQTLKRFDDAQY